MLHKGAFFLILLYNSFACTDDHPIEIEEETFIDTEIAFHEAALGDPKNRTRILVGDEGKIFFPDGYFFQYRLLGSKKANYLYYKKAPKRIKLPKKSLDIVLSNRPYNLKSNKGMIGTSIYREDSVLWAKSAYSPHTKKLKFDNKRLDGRFVIQFAVFPEIKYYSLSLKEERYDFDPFYEDESEKWVKGKKSKQNSDILIPIPTENIMRLKTYFIINPVQLKIRLFDENKVQVFKWQNTDPIRFLAESSSLLLRIIYNRSIENFEISDVSDVDSFEVDQIIDIDNSGE